MQNLVRIANNLETAAILCNRQDGSLIEVYVDIADLPLIAQIPGTWGVSAVNATQRERERNGDLEDAFYCSSLIDGKRIMMHRHIMMTTHDISALEINHVNGSGTDNRRCNLEVCTRKENASLMRLPARASKRNQLGIRGVSCRNGSFLVQAQGQYHGSYKTLDEAQAAYEDIRQRVNCRRLRGGR